MTLLTHHLRTSSSFAALALCGVIAACGGKSSKNGESDPDPNGDGDGDGDRADPDTSNIFVEQIRASANTELDLLLVVDNSQQMAEKQALLAEAIPRLVGRLTSPDCITETGARVPNTNGCDPGSSPEFPRFTSLHLGVISSSLGGAGSPTCSRAEVEFNWDDRAHLLPTIRNDIADTATSGFLSWSNGDNPDDAVSTFVDHVQAAGEKGCGLEATLESWYRFLIDPQPPLDVVVDGSSKSVVATDSNGTPLIDGELLAQRAAFLRPESTVAIVMLTDENDCSMMMGGSYYNNAGFGYLTGQFDFDMPISTSVCEQNPNDKCCFSCLQKNSPPDGCSAAECESSTPLSGSEDRANVRCFNQKRRFGVDLLYPTDRYVEALTRPTMIDAWSGNEVDNPLLRGAGASNQGRVRDPGRVHIMGIVGVPWQDLATTGSLNSANTMEYMSPRDLTAKSVTINGADFDRWELILGAPGRSASSKACETSSPDCGKQPEPPLDPFMIESITERTAGLAHPLTGDLIVDATSSNPLANNINGHESNHLITSTDIYVDGAAARDQLQNACIFPLQTPKVACAPEDGSCDCQDEPLRNRATCQPPEGGTVSTTQYFGKATPGTRILQVLRDVGANAYPASICPKVTTGDPSDPSYGYGPAMDALATGIGESAGGAGCLPRELTVDEAGGVPCVMVEASPDAGTLSCSANGRKATSPEVRSTVEKQLRATGRCDGNAAIPCDNYTMCEIEPLTGAGREECLYSEGDAATFSDAGYCYIDPALQDSNGKYFAGGGDDGTNALVAHCPSSERRLLRFVGANTPANSSVVFIACTAEAATSSDPEPF